MQSNAPQTKTPNPCCCCSLKIGSTAGAILEIVAGVVFVLFLVLVLASGSFNVERAKGIQTTQQEYEILSHKVTRENEKVPEEVAEEKGEEPLSTFTFVHVIIQIPLCVIYIIFGCLLVDAIRKKKEKVFRLWIAFSVVTMLLNVILYSVEYFIVDGLSIIGPIAIVVCLIFNCWIISVVYYHRQELLAEGSNQVGIVGYSSYKIQNSVSALPLRSNSATVTKPQTSQTPPPSFKY